MPIEELTAFRAKFPQYGDLGDSELAGMLASKYPAYKDLPQRLAVTPEIPVKLEGGGADFSKLAGGAEAKIQKPGGFWRTLGEGIFQGPQGPEGVAPPPLQRFQQALRAVNAPFEAIGRGVAGPVAETGLVSPTKAEVIGEGVGAVATMVPPIRAGQAIGRAVMPKRTIQDLITPRPPAPPAQLPPPSPESMVMQATPEGVVSQAPKRNIVDLVDEIKQDLKAQVIEELAEELRAGRPRPAAAAAPRQIEAPRHMQETPAPRPQVQAPAIELPPPERPKIIMGQSGYRGAGDARPMREPGPPVAPETPAPATRPIDEIKTLVDPQTGNFTRGGDYINNLLKKSSDDEVMEFLKWAKRPEASRYVNRFGGDYAADELRTRGVPVDSSKWQFENLPKGPPEAPANVARETLPEVPKVQKETVKEPWELTLQGYLDQQYPGRKARPGLYPNLDHQHEMLTRQAAREGKPVPPKVLAEYPPIQKETPPVAPGAQIEPRPIPEAQPAAEGTEEALRMAAEGARLKKTPPVAPTKTPFEIEYDTVLTNWREEAKRFTKAQTAYRKKEIGDNEYLAARREFEKQQGIFDQAETDFIKKTNAATTPEKLLPPRQRTIGGLLKGESGAIPEAQPELKIGGRSLKEILESEKGQVGSTTEAPFVTRPRLAMGEAIEQSSKTVRKTMGPEGNELMDRLFEVRNRAERDTGMATQPLEDSIKLLKKGPEWENFVNVLEGKASPLNERVTKAVNIADQTRQEIARRASAANLQTKNPITGEFYPFQSRENYFPHYSTKQLADVVKTPDGRARIKAQIKEQLESRAKEGTEITDRQVEQSLQAMVKASKGREGHLEISRVLDLGDYSKDPRVFLKYINDAYRRINVAEQMGPRLEKAEELLTAIGQQKGDLSEGFARTLLNREIGLEELPDTLAKSMMEGARNYEAFTKLGRAFIPNLSQHAYTAVVTGVKDTTKGMAAAMTRGGKDFARRAGVVNDDVIRQFMDEVTGGTEGKLRKATQIELAPFRWTERLNRVTAANAGKYYARETFDTVLNNTDHKGARATLEKMGIDVDEALKRGALSEVDELKAGQNIVNRTQFKVNAAELPLFWSSPEGKLLTQFKSFNFKSGQFIKDEVLKELVKGNVAPFARAVAILPAAGFAVKKVQNALRPGSKDDKEGIADYLAAVGVLGLFSDIFRNAGRTGEGFLAGPSLSDVGQGVGAIATARERLAEGKDEPLKPFGKFLARQVPVAGPTIGGLLNRPKTDREKLIEELGISRESMSRKKMKAQLGIER